MQNNTTNMYTIRHTHIYGQTIQSTQVKSRWRTKF